MKKHYQKKNIREKFFKCRKGRIVMFFAYGVLAIGIGMLIQKSLTSEGATFGWVQSDWTGGATSNTADHADDQTGWSEYSSKDPNVDTSTPGEISLQNASETTLQDTTDEDFQAANVSGTAEASIQGDSVRMTVWSCGDSVQDIEGNTYGTVEIGTQCWMSENMRTTQYPDGTSITKGPTSEGASGWDTDQGYYSCPPNSANDGEDCAAADSLGMLYQWSAAMDGSTTEGAQGICPDGWHVATDSEWHTLEDYLSESTCDPSRDGSWDCDPAGSKLAGNDAADENWNSGTLTGHADFDSSGFNAPPSGSRYTAGNYAYRSSYAYFWSSSESGSYAWRRNLSDGYSTVFRYDNDKAFGFSVRCLKD
jgi:uncharacterized protein (TIGR02145 family)